MSDTTNSTSAMPSVEMLRSHSLTKAVQQELERMILDGELAPASRVNENALASQLSVSRGPIREACRALAELGFVDIVPKRGVFVKCLNRGDAIEVYDLRAGLLGLAASLLAPVVTARHIDELERLLEKMERAGHGRDFAAFSPLNIAFHDVIVRATNNSRLIKANDGLVKEFHLFRAHGLAQQDALIASNKEHRAIVAALRSADPRQAYDTSFDHVFSGKQRMLVALDGLKTEGAA